MDEKGSWRLSPAYDMGLSYNPNGLYTSKHQMSIAGIREGITKKDLLEFADKENISKAGEIIRQVREAVLRYPVHAEEAGIPSGEINAIMDVIREKMSIFDKS